MQINEYILYLKSKEFKSLGESSKVKELVINIIPNFEKINNKINIFGIKQISSSQWTKAVLESMESIDISLVKALGDRVNIGLNGGQILYTASFIDRYDLIEYWLDSYNNEKNLAGVLENLLDDNKECRACFYKILNKIGGFKKLSFFDEYINLERRILSKKECINLAREIVNELSLEELVRMHAFYKRVKAVVSGNLNVIEEKINVLEEAKQLNKIIALKEVDFKTIKKSNV